MFNNTYEGVVGGVGSSMIHKVTETGGLGGVDKSC